MADTFERAPRECPCCGRPFPGHNGYDPVRHCPRVSPKAVHLVPCLLAGLERRESELVIERYLLETEQKLRRDTEARLERARALLFENRDVIDLSDVTLGGDRG